MSKDTISVIVPIYNSESSLCRCIDSLLSQTYSAVELILIDDGSVDSSLAICTRYAAVDNRIRVIHQQNSGVAVARNKGLACATGKYVCFVDSDDYVLPDYLYKMWCNMSPERDLVFSYSVNKIENVNRIQQCESVCLRNSDVGRIFSINNNISKTGPWSKLFRNEIIQRNNILFPKDLPIGEDAVFLMNYLCFCNNVILTDDHDYVYVVDSANSLTKKHYSLTTELMIKQSIEQAICGFKAVFSGCDRKTLRIFDALISMYTIRVLDSLYFTEEYSRIERIDAIKRIPREDIKTIEIRGSNRAIVLALLLRFHFFRAYDLLRSFARHFRH